MATQDDYIRTALRVPPDLHAQIHGAAKENNRTFNAEIVARLQQTFENSSTSENLITMTMDDAESLISRALERAGHAIAKNSSP